MANYTIGNDYPVYQSAVRSATPTPKRAQSSSAAKASSGSSASASASAGAVYERSATARVSSAADVVKQTDTARPFDPYKGVGAGAVTQSADYGNVVGEPKLSEEGQKYYDELKRKYGNMNFVLVSKDQVQAAKSQTGSYATPGKMTVLIDEDKVEAMASDPKMRKLYEGIIAQGSNGQLPQINNNPLVQKTGATTDGSGASSFFAVVSKNADANHKQQVKRQEKKAAEKKQAAKTAEKKAEKKAEQKKAEKERLEKKRAEKGSDDPRDRDVFEVDPDLSTYEDDDNYEIIRADSLDELADKVDKYTKSYFKAEFQTHFFDKGV